MLNKSCNIMINMLKHEGKKSQGKKTIANECTHEGTTNKKIYLKLDKGFINKYTQREFSYVVQAINNTCIECA